MYVMVQYRIWILRITILCVYVHVLTCYFLNAVCVCSDEDEEEALDWLPMAPEIEDPEEPGWGQLEVSTVCTNLYVLAIIGAILSESQR